MILAVLVLAELTAAFETSMILAALKTLLETFGRPVAVGWLVTSYLLVASASAAVGGRLGDLYGRSRVLMGALMCAAVGSFISAASTSLEGVILGRAVQGLAGAILPLCFGLVREHLPVHRTSFGVGVVSATAAAGAGGGLILGGLLVDNGHWSWIFLASGGTAVAGFLLALWKLPRSPVSPTVKSGVDLLGGVMFAPGIAGLLLAVSNAPSLGWGDPRVWGVGLASAALLTVWVRHELRHPNPLIDVRLLANRQIALANICAAMVAFAGSSFPQLLMLLVQQPVWTGVGLGVTATVAGLMKLPGNVISTTMAPFTGLLCGRYGGRFGLIIGAPFAAAGMLALTTFNDNLWVVVAFSAIISLGVSMMYVGAPSIIVAEAPVERTSEATGFMTVVRSVAQAMGAQAIVLMLATSTVKATADGAGVYPSAEAYQLALAVMGAVALAPGLIALFFTRPPELSKPNQA